MTKAEEIFRSFFDDGEDGDREHFAFVLKHRLESIDEPGHAHAVCTRAGPDANPQSYEDKPAMVMVFDNWLATVQVEWRDEHGLHRINGPAQMIVYADGRVIRNWYENGVRVARSSR